MIDPTARVHATADLEPDVSVGPLTSIWHGAQIRRRALIGAECVIGRDAFIDENVEIGNRVKIQNGALVYQGVTVGSGVFIGPGAILTNDRYPRAVTAAGELARAGDWQLDRIVLHEGCSIGAGAVIVAGVEIGAFCTVGAGAVVTRSTGTHSLVVGNPARQIGWVCRCGARLLENSGAPAGPAASGVATCTACGRTFELLDGSAVEQEVA